MTLGFSLRKIVNLKIKSYIKLLNLEYIVWASICQLYKLVPKKYGVYN